MFGILYGFLGAIVGLILLIAIWPRLWSRHPAIKHSVLALALLLIANLFLVPFL